MIERKVRLLRRAATALRDIGAWTDVRFGPLQAARYLGDLRDSFGSIADGTAVTWDCSQLVRNAPAGLRFARSGQHFIVFVEHPLEVAVLDIIHQRMDLPGKIARLVKKPESR